MTEEQINNKYNSLKPNAMIRISDYDLYACLNNTQRSIKLWNSAGYALFGKVEAYADDLYFATTEHYTIIILLNKNLESEFCQLANAAKTVIESSDNPESHPRILKNLFDAWRSPLLEAYFEMLRAG